MAEEPLDRWAERREGRRRPVGARCATPLEGGPARGDHTRQAARWLLFEWDGYQWVAQGVADDYAASRRYLARIEGDGMMRPELYIGPGPALRHYVGLGDKAPAKPYRLLAEALRSSGQVAVTKIAIRERESLAILRERDGLLILQTVRWPDEIRSREGIHGAPADEPVDKREIKMAIQYAQAKSEGYDLEAERDAYVVALEELLAAKASGGEAPHEAEPIPRGAPVIDIMAALKASIEETQAAREAAGAPAKKTAKKTPAKRTPRKAG